MTLSLHTYIEEIRKARLEKGWSQKELSKRSGLTQSHVSRIEHGAIDLRLSNLLELSRALDLEVFLVPRSTVPAIKSLLQQLMGKNTTDTSRAYTLDDEENAE